MKLDGEINSKSIKDFFQRFQNIEKVVYLIKNKIGYDKNKKQLRHSVTLKNPSEYINDTVPFDLVSENNTGTLTLQNINGKPYIASNPTAIKGLYQHIDNNLLYISMDPMLVNDDYNEALPYQAEIAVDKPLDNRLAIGRQHLKNMMNRVAGQHKDKQIRLIVLGNSGQLDQEPENFDVYKEMLTTENIVNDQPLIGSFALLTENLDIEPEVVVNYIHMEKIRNNIKLFEGKNNALKNLYYIYKSTISQGNPVIIHCDDGLDRASKLALAFELLRKFEEHFSSDNIYQIRMKVTDALNQIRRTVSPNALSKIEDLNQAMHLAFAMKMIAIEEKCIEELQTFFAQQGMEIQAIKIKIDALLARLNALPYAKDKATTLKSAVMSDLDYSKRLSFWKPGHYPLVKNLQQCLKTHGDIEEKLAIICQCPLENNVIELVSQSLN